MSEERTAAPIPYTELPPRDRYAGDRAKGEIELLGEHAAVLLDNKYCKVLQDDVQWPGGATGTYLRVFHPEELKGRHGVVIVPTFEDQLYFIRLFRHPVRSWQIEFPRGFAEPDLTPLQNAQKELDEELKVEAAAIEELGEVCPNTGFLATYAHVYHAELSEPPPRTTDALSQQAEAISGVISVDRNRLLEDFRDPAQGICHQIKCGFTLAALMLAVSRRIAG